MSRAFEGASPALLQELAQAIEQGWLSWPPTELGLRRRFSEAEGEMIAQGIAVLGCRTWKAEAVAALLRALGAERAAVQAVRDEVELVWTGPELPGTASRDTWVMVQELFRGARRSVLLSTYSFYDAAELFTPLARHLEKDSSFRVRMFVNVERNEWEKERGVPEERVLERYAESFRKHQWPQGARLPEVFYDPRALASEPASAVLHAKCVVVDDELALVTSANFTQAAHRRNIEAGVLVRSPALARRLVLQFEHLVSGGVLRRLPWPE